MNLLFLDFIENCSLNLSKSVNTEALSLIKDVSQNMTLIPLNINQKLVDMQDKLHGLNKEQMDNLKLLLQSVLQANASKEREEIEKTMNLYSDLFVSKVVNGELPKNNELLLGKFKESLQAFHVSLSKDKEQDATLKELDSKLQPVYMYLKLLEERTHVSTDKEEKLSKTLNEISEFLNKYKSNSSFKGQSSENKLFSVLMELFPGDELIESHTTANSGDFIVKREGKPDILLENKDYNVPVDKVEIKKFIDDIRKNHCSGIFLSQHTGITGKRNFQIDLDDHHVLVYIHQAEYSRDKIATAVSIIDHFTEKLSQHEVNGELISKEVLDKINTEYSLMLEKRKSIVAMMKDFTKKMECELNQLELPDLSNYLSKKYAKTNPFPCALCSFSSTSKHGLRTHMNVHNRASVKVPLVVPAPVS
jgi:hypothetical protein